MTKPHGLPFHYGWIVVACGFLTIFSCLGLARFSFSMLLPPMSASLGLSYSESGFLGTGYFIGYLVSILALPYLFARVTGKKLVLYGLSLIAVTAALIASVGNFLLLAILYALTGIGSGLANIPVVSLISHWFSPSLRGRASGIAIGGSGAAIILSGQVIPALDGIEFIADWRAGWFLVSLATAIVALVVLTLLRDRPSEMGLEPVGRKPAGSPAPHDAALSAAAERRILVHFGSIYFLFGATYMIYGTFIVTTLIDDYGFTADSAGDFWAEVGFFSLFSGFLFGALSDRLGRKAGLMAAFAAHTVSYAIVAFDAPPALLQLSIFLFGIAAWSVPSIMAAAMADYLGPLRAATALSVVTLFFAAGQVFGPATAGMMSDLTGSFSLSYLLAAVLTATAVLLSAFLSRPAGVG